MPENMNTPHLAVCNMPYYSYLSDLPCRYTDVEDAIANSEKCSTLEDAFERFKEGDIVVLCGGGVVYLANGEPNA
jgi:hypothetical protein